MERPSQGFFIADFQPPLDPGADSLLIEGDIAKTVETYTKSEHVANRQIFGKVLEHILHQPLDALLENMSEIKDALTTIVEDKELTVRSDFMDHIPAIFVRCYEISSAELEDQLYDRLINIALNGLQDTNTTVRQHAYKSLCVMIEKYLIDRNRLLNIVCPFIIQLSVGLTYETNETQKSQMSTPEPSNQFELAAALMANAAPVIGKEKTEELFLDRFLELCEVESYTVRRACATYYPFMCKVMGPEVTDKRLIEPFLQLCNDEIWSVRESCSESISIIAFICSNEKRWNDLTPAFINMVKDASRWVCTIAHKVVGYFISSFSNPLATGIMYTAQGDLQVINTADTEFREICEGEIIANYEYYEQMFADSIHQNSPANVSLPSTSSEVVETTRPPYSPTTTIDVIRKSYFMQASNMKGCTLSLTRHDWRSKIAKMTLDEALPPINYNLIEDGRTLAELKDEITFCILNKLQIFEFEPEREDTDIWGDSLGFDGQIDPGFHLRRRSQPLKKNTPTDLPSIIEQAISNRQKEFSEKNAETSSSSTASASSNVTKRKKGNAFKINIDEKREEPPETPSIENSPTFLTFMTTNTTTSSSEHTQINASSSGISWAMSKSLENLSDINLKSKTATDDGSKCSPTNLDSKLENLANNLQSDSELSGNSSSTETTLPTDYPLPPPTSAIIVTPPPTPSSSSNCSDENDDLNTEFNSHQFWYIPPELPLKELELLSLNSTSSGGDSGMPVSTSPSSTSSSMTGNVSGGSPNNSTSKPQECSRAELGLATLKRDLIKGPVKFEQDVLPPKLLETYVNMLQRVDDELIMYAGYNFPAVLLTIGRKNWNFLCKPMFNLLNHHDFKIRRTIAASIYQIAVILGRDITKRDLIPIFSELLMDERIEVRVAALKNLSNFLKVLDFEMHDKIIKCLDFFIDSNSFEGMSWRILEELAKQILALIKMYENMPCKERLMYLTVVALSLCTQKVNIVREIAYDAIVLRLNSCTEDETAFIIDKLIKLASDEHWRKRQSFAIICYKVVSNSAIKPEVFVEHFLDTLLNLATDKVPNVRLVVAKCLSKSIITHPYFNKPSTEQYEQIYNVLEGLRHDSDCDVAEQSICDLFPEDVVEEKVVEEELKLEPYPPPPVPESSDDDEDVIVNHEVINTMGSTAATQIFNETVPTEEPKPTTNSLLMRWRLRESQGKDGNMVNDDDDEDDDDDDANPQSSKNSDSGVENENGSEEELEMGKDEDDGQLVK